MQDFPRLEERIHELKFVKGGRATVKHCPLVQEAIRDAEILSYKKSFTFSHNGELYFTLQRSF